MGGRRKTKEILYIAWVKFTMTLLGINESLANRLILFLLTLYVRQPHRGDADCILKEEKLLVSPLQFRLLYIYAAC